MSQDTPQSYGTGRRKTAKARVYLRPGSGAFRVNRSSFEDYFASEVHKMMIRQPLVITETSDRFDILVRVRGGGFSGQAGAVRHGISKALTLYEPGLRPVLKSGGFLTRDSRVVERKKYGKAKASRSFQFSKR